MECNNQTDYNMVSQLALRVALQTMKERCLSLQQRLSVVEEENDSLRSRLDSEQGHNCTSFQENKPTSHNSIELDTLRSQVSELNRQKIQLSDHINMVANENRKLWSRLSQIAKEQQGTIVEENQSGNNATPHSTSDELDSPRAHQNLIRSRTFTQHSPNPNLRLKVINDKNIEGDNDEEPSLEEVLLVEAVSDDDEGSNRELKSDELIGMCETELGFTYLNVHAATDDDFNIEAKKCLEGLHKIRLEVLQQQHNMTSALDTLESRFALQTCSVCAKKPEMIDKSLDTEGIIAQMPEFLHIPHQVELPAYLDRAHEAGEEDEDDEDNTQAQSSHIDFIQRKLEADKKVKVCPMCNLVFGVTVTFDQFCCHVESHFVQESSSDSEQNYEFIAHTVGDF